MQRAQCRSAVDADLAALERQLGDMLGLKVQVAHKGQGGTVTLHYSSLDQLDMICQRLTRRADLGFSAGAPARAIASSSSPSASLVRRIGPNISCRSSLPARSATVASRSRVPLRQQLCRPAALSFQNNDLPSDVMTASGRSPRSTRARIGASISRRR